LGLAGRLLALEAAIENVTPGGKAPKTHAGSGFSSVVHSPECPFTGCTQAGNVSHLREAGMRVQSQRIQFTQGFELRKWN
jgi:hypothetical protein